MLKNRLSIFAGFITLLVATSAHAADEWKITQIEAGAYPEEIVAETRAASKNGLPDGLITTHDGGDIASAWYSQPTERYRHGILGDKIEAGSLMIKTNKGRTLKIDLPRSEVFEDRAPRLADLNGNGKIEVITLRSSVTKGGSVTVYGLSGGALVQKATTGFIGRANRWLNIAAITPMLGTKYREIAFVQTPHIGGTLFVYRYSRGKLIQVDAGRDFSNHVIGSREMRLSAIADINADGKADVAVPSANRTRLRIMGFGSAGLKDIAGANLPSPINKAIAVQSKGQKGFVVGLENGDIYLVHP